MSKDAPKSFELTVWQQHAAALAITLIGAAFALVYALRSDGYYHDDDICHYLIAIKAWGNIQSMLDWWGRPGYTIPTMVAAHFGGFTGCRILSVMLTTAVAFMAYLIARRIIRPGRYSGMIAALAPGLVWIQPLVFTLAITTLTETVAGFYLTMGVWLYMRGNRVWGMIPASLAIVTRHEMAALVMILCAAAVVDSLRLSGWKVGPALRTWWMWAAVAAALWAPIAYIVIGEFVLPAWSRPIAALRSPVTENYGTGPWDHHLLNSLETFGGAVLALAAAGATCRRAILPAAIAIGMIAMHMVIFTIGVPASGGYARFLVPIGGLVGALAACGIAEALSPKRLMAGPLIFLVLAYAIHHRCYFFGQGLCDYSSVIQTIYLLAGLAAAAAGQYIVLKPKSPAAGWLEGSRLWLAQVGIAMAAILMSLQAHWMIQPLSIQNNWFAMAFKKSQAQVAALGYGDGPVMTCNVAMEWLRPDAKHTDWREISKVWPAAAPGTLFYWDNKYAGPRQLEGATEAERTNDAYGALVHYGRMIDARWVESANVEVFVRLPDSEIPADGWGMEPASQSTITATHPVSRAATAPARGSSPSPGLAATTPAVAGGEDGK